MSPKTMPSAAMASRVAGHRGFGDSPGLDMRRPTLAASWLDPASMKTNAARLLDTLNIRYELRTYPVDPDDLSAVGVAEKVGLPAGQLFKTLVCRGDRTGVCLAVLPADRELDLKALARARGDRRFDTVPLREIQPLTGYVRGGVTALAARREYPVVIDVSALEWPIISVSAGMRGAQLLLAPADSQRVTGATAAAIARPEPDAAQA
jgi:Cys-tRNA(Pro)/Cys-tRNA(Cys) deacylase